MKSKIKKFESACKAEKIDSKLLPIVNHLDEKSAKKSIADYKVDVIIKALNSEGQDKPWIADYTDYSQSKYEIYWQYTAGSGWSFDGVDFWLTGTSCGSSRVFRTREIAEYFAENFLDLMQDIL
jgi:hypothetical protein